MYGNLILACGSGNVSYESWGEEEIARRKAGAKAPAFFVANYS